MTVLETPAGDVQLRSDQVQAESSLERTPSVTPAGVPVILGDGGWAPERIRITVTVADPLSADGVAEVELLLARLRTATRLRTLDRAADIVALQRVRRTNRGVQWGVLADLIIGPWTDLSTANTVTVLGQSVTIGGLPLTVEVT
mgnify:CR=1 FL=1